MDLKLKTLAVASVQSSITIATLFPVCLFFLDFEDISLDIAIALEVLLVLISSFRIAIAKKVILMSEPPSIHLSIGIRYGFIISGIIWNVGTVFIFAYMNNVASTITLLCTVIFATYGLVSFSVEKSIAVSTVVLYTLPIFWFSLLSHQPYYLLFLICLLIGGVCSSFFSNQFVGKIFESIDALREKSSQDSMTGLYTKQHLSQMFTHILVMKRPFVLAIYDIDHFKSINDTYGHITGDSIIKQVADKVKSAAQRPLDTPCRFGGEEFLIVWVDIDFAEAKKIVESLRSDIGLVKSGDCCVTASCGWVHSIELEQFSFLDSVIETADKRLYLAKKSGRNKTVP